MKLEKETISIFTGFGPSGPFDESVPWSVISVFGEFLFKRIGDTICQLVVEHNDKKLVLSQGLSM